MRPLREIDKKPPDVAVVMQLVLLCLTPGISVFVFQTGWGGLFNICIAVFAAVLFESIALVLRKKDPRSTINDYSAIVTGVLIALCLPPLLPWWIPVLAAAFAILLAKHCYGGLGQNIFNPAMAGYAIILISFPKDLSLWLTTPDTFNTHFLYALELFLNGGLSHSPDWDALTGATALDKSRELILQGVTPADIKSKTSGLFGAVHSEWLNLAYLIGGLGLLYIRIINWQIPVGVLIGMAGCSVIQNIFFPASPITPLFHLFSGATMLCAFFIATDPVSAAASNRGRLIYALGIGILIVVIRSYGSYPDSIAFSVLLMNCMVPLIDRIEPHIYQSTRS